MKTKFRPQKCSGVMVLANVKRNKLYYKTGEASNIHCRTCNYVQDSYSGPSSISYNFYFSREIGSSPKLIFEVN